MCWILFLFFEKVLSQISHVKFLDDESISTVRENVNLFEPILMVY